jgi:hypothetical protein
MCYKFLYKYLFLQISILCRGIRSPGLFLKNRLPDVFRIHFKIFFNIKLFLCLYILKLLYNKTIYLQENNNII